MDCRHTDHRHKLELDVQGATPRLFGLGRDPDEFLNFIDAPEYRDVVLKSASAVNTYMVENNDNDPEVHEAIGELLQKRAEVLEHAK